MSYQNRQVSDRRRHVTPDGAVRQYGRLS